MRLISLHFSTLYFYGKLEWNQGRCSNSWEKSEAASACLQLSSPGLEQHQRMPLNTGGGNEVQRGRHGLTHTFTGKRVTFALRGQCRKKAKCRSTRLSDRCHWFREQEHADISESGSNHDRRYVRKRWIFLGETGRMQKCVTLFPRDEVLGLAE